MNPDRNAARLLGATFLFQALVPLISGLLLTSLIVSGNITATMTNLATHAFAVRASIVGETLTAIAVATLGYLLYVTLKRQNEQLAAVGLVSYVLEAAVIVASQLAVFALLRTSQAAVIAGHPADLQTLGTLFYDTRNFGMSLLMLPFAIGATLFYYLLVRSRLVPGPLAVFGLGAAILALIGIPFALLGADVPIYVFLPNLPFELGIGVWLLVKGASSAPVSPASGVVIRDPEGVATYVRS